MLCSGCEEYLAVQSTACGIGYCSPACEDFEHPKICGDGCFSTPTSIERNFWKEWLVEEELGEGSRGIVVSAVSASDPTDRRALKLIGEVRLDKRFLAELEMMCHLHTQCPELLTYTGVFYTMTPEWARQRIGTTLTIVLMMPYVAGDALDEHVARVLYQMEKANAQESVVPLMDVQKAAKSKHNREEALRTYQKTISTDGLKWAAGVALSLARQLKCIHDAGYEHRDVKPANILYDGEVHLVDFDLSGKVGGSLDKVYGTVGFIAPELNRPNPPQDRRVCDVWSYGATLYYLFSGEDLIEPEEGDVIGEKNYRTTMKRLRELFEMPFKKTNPVRELIFGCLTPDLKQRWTLEAVISRLESIVGEIGARGGGGGRGFGGRGMRGGRGGGGGRGGRVLRSSPRLARRGVRTSRTTTRPRAFSRSPVVRARRFWRSRFSYPPWYVSLLPLWYASAMFWWDPLYPVYPITVDIADEIALQAELAALRAQNAALMASGEFALVPDLTSGQYVWIRRQ